MFCLVRDLLDDHATLTQRRLRRDSTDTEADMTSTQEIAEFRSRVRTWLAEYHRPGLSRQEWLQLVVDYGFAVPTWSPEWHGLGVSVDLAAVVSEEFQLAHATGANQDKHNLWANTLLTYGTEALKRRLIRPLLLDEVKMCLLYSEPGAGSDLAGLQTRADSDGDEYIVTGQKVWTSGAHEADYGMLIARTDWDVPKHRGLSFFFFPMKQPGVVVRPIRQITGESHFNEVFIDRAHVPAENLLGRINEGWQVLQTALAYERSVMGDVARGPRRPAGSADGSTESVPSGASGADSSRGRGKHRFAARIRCLASMFLGEFRASRRLSFRSPAY